GLEVRDEPFVLYNLEGAPDDRDPGAVIAAVLEALEPVEQDRQGIASAGITDDPAHLQDPRARRDRAAQPSTGLDPHPFVDDRPRCDADPVSDLRVLADQGPDLG